MSESKVIKVINEEMDKLIRERNELRANLQAVIDFHELPRAEFYAKYPVGVTWGELVNNARAALRAGDE